MLTSKKKISTKIQLWMIICTSVIFVISILWCYISNTNNSKEMTEELLTYSINDVCNSVREADSIAILMTTSQWARYFDACVPSLEPTKSFTETLRNIADANNIDDISFINDKGIIYSSNKPKYIGYDMASHDQSREFLVILKRPEIHAYVQKLRKRGFDNVEFRYAACELFHHKGFLQFGFNDDHYQNMVTGRLTDATSYYRVGKTGALYIFDDDFKVISKPKDVSLNAIQASKFSRKELVSHKPSELFNVVLNGVPCICMYKIEHGCYVVAVQPVSESTIVRNTAVFTTSVNIFVVCFVLIVVIWLLIKHLVVENIDKINDSLSKITDGDLTEITNVRNSVEFDSLSTDINKTVKRLKEYIHEAETRMDDEFALAKGIQQSMLPQPLAVPQLTIDSLIVPAKNVSGDLYYYFLRNNYLYFCIGDVSGKGLPASLFMSKTISLFACISRYAVRADDIAEQLNVELCQNNSRSMFVTMFIGIINLTSGELQYCNAGHDEPLYWNGLDSSKPHYLYTSENIPLGVDENETYTQHEVFLKAGSRFFLYTDGVTEAKRKDLEMYGEQRLLDCFSRYHNDFNKSMCSNVLTDIREFVDNNQQSDDITMLSIAIKHIDKTIVLKNDITELTKLPCFFDNIAKVLIYSQEDLIQIRMAIDEVMTNCIRYAYKDTEVDKDSQLVFLRVYTANGQLIFVITDDGIPFNPLTYEEHSLEDIQNLDIDDIKIGGLGIPLMKKTFDELDYQRTSNKNILTLKKNLK